MPMDTTTERKGYILVPEHSAKAHTKIRAWKVSFVSVAKGALALFTCTTMICFAKVAYHQPLYLNINATVIVPQYDERQQKPTNTTPHIHTATHIHIILDADGMAGACKRFAAIGIYGNTSISSNTYRQRKRGPSIMDISAEQWGSSYGLQPSHSLLSHLTRKSKIDSSV